MKKSSQWALGGSLVLFLAAGTVKFWPEDRFLPVASPGFGGFGGGFFSGSSSAGLMPAARSFAPGWAESASLPQTAPKPQPGTPFAADAAPQMPRRVFHIPSDSGAPPFGRYHHVTLAAQKMPVGKILSRLFHQAGVGFALTDRWDEPMTITFSDAPLEQVIGQTLSLTTRPRLTCRIENGTYVIEALPVLSSLPLTPPAQTATPLR